MKTDEMLDAAKRKLQITSDYALAKALETSTAKIGQWRTGKRTPDEQACFQIAEILGIEPAAVIAAIRLDREKEPGKVEFWKRQAARYATSAGVVATLLAGSAQAGTLGNVAAHGNSTPYALCEMKQRRKRREWGLLYWLWNLETWITETILPLGMAGHSGKTF